MHRGMLTARCDDRSVTARCHTGFMDPILALIIGLLVGVLLGAVIGLLLARARHSNSPTAIDPALIASQHELALSAVRAEEATAKSLLGSELAAIQATAVALKEQVVAQQEQYRELVDRQRRDQAAESDRQQRESKVLQALTPVQESLRSMQSKVTELETQRTLQHGQLTQQLRNATESEERLRSTAESLASALRNNATRGVWGETQLRSCWVSWPCCRVRWVSSSVTFDCMLRRDSCTGVSA